MNMKVKTKDATGSSCDRDIRGHVGPDQDARNLLQVLSLLCNVHVSEYEYRAVCQVPVVF